MKSPFPGMDPYLEQYWGDMHTKLATYASDHLNKKIPEDLISSIEEHIVVESDDAEDSQVYYSNLQVEELSDGAVADSIDLPRKNEPMTQRSIRIIEAKGNRIVTAIEFLSPANKVGTAGRRAYNKKRDDLLDGDVSLVEIDLIREGRPNLAIETKSIPTRYRQAYRICVVRAWRVPRAQVYRVSLRHRLPVVSIPLREKDKEVSLDLQALIDMAYENGRYFRRGYRDDPEPPLAGEDAKWADQLLKEKGLR